MLPFYIRCEEVARRETRSFQIKPLSGAEGLPNDEYAILEFYCDDSSCDCRRGFFQIISKARGGTVLASINYGWESRKFYRRQMPFIPEAAREITEGSLDPLNRQSPLAQELLEIFRQVVADESYKMRLKRHYELFQQLNAKKNFKP